MQQLLDFITQKIDSPILSCSALSGGDISNIYLLETRDQRFVLKTNRTQDALAMFQAEKMGLEAIAITKIIQTPLIYQCERYLDTAFLLMEYISSKRPNKMDFERLGQKIGKLHRISATTFGWEKDNFIGNLRQSNTNYTTWLDFYISERLMPQFQLAQKAGLLSVEEIPAKTTLLKKGMPLFRNIQPALLHGDLWSGNYLIALDGTPYLIDPATYYGHSEKDIAMTRLFGGFGATFYDAYHEIHPPQDGITIRQNWYQLYYLLVHLNLCGKGYYGQVKQILATF